MPRDAVSRTANVERNGGHKWVNQFGLEIYHFKETVTGNVNIIRATFLSKYLKKIIFFNESRGIIRIRMHCFIFVLLTFNMCHLEVPDIA